MKDVKAVVDFLRGKKFFLATISEDGKPKVRPFGAVALYNDKLYICTSSTKDVSKQMKVNSNVEIAAMGEGMDWLRLTGTAILDDSESAKEVMFEQNPNLNNIYSDDRRKLFEVFYLQDATAGLVKMDGSVENL
jgi:uncharacterized pyridoxamine 5'-phosphate oxidase family protein